MGRQKSVVMGNFVVIYILRDMYSMSDGCIKPIKNASMSYRMGLVAQDGLFTFIYWASVVVSIVLTEYHNFSLNLRRKL